MSQQPPNRPNLDDYVPVHERIAAFYEKFPEGSLQSEIVVMTDTSIAMVARAFRTPTDERPGIGHSSIEVPGRTPYTRGSEMENCETSAWGRAIAALGFEIKRGIATKEEVESKSGSPAEAPKKPATAPRPVAAAEAPPAGVGPELTDDDWGGIVTTEATPQPLFESVDGTCPDHNKPWKHGAKGYFCSTPVEKDGDKVTKWCQQRPSRAWVEAQAA